MPDKKVLLDNTSGKRVFLLGNEAIARGILEAGIGVVTTYPGTPASEIGDSISEISPEAGVYMEYSVNEMVAVEVAAGAANSGVRSLVAMKHVGLNVAADMLMSLAYTGVRRGCVIVTADDPECFSSQNEQDNRYYALLSNLPCLEPSDPEEAKNMTVQAIELSEQLELPVLLRTTTRVNHTRGPVTFGSIQKAKMKGDFIREPKRLLLVPAYSRPKHDILLKQVAQAQEISEHSLLNKVTHEGDEIGIISSGSAYNYAVEAAQLLNLRAGILKLGMTHPLPEEKISKFIDCYKQVAIIEELEPIVEMQVRAISQRYGIEVEIYGKMGTEFFPRAGELNTELAVKGLSRITNTLATSSKENMEKAYETAIKGLPPRPPILCAGCPHRASFYVIKKVGGEQALYSDDIGCYALGMAPPLKVGDILVCMGASVGMAQGINKATGRNSLATLGDSTFFHAAIPGLVNAVYNDSHITVVVLDNSATAMTGHQPHPGTGLTGMHISHEKVRVEKVAEGCGVKYVRVVNPFKTKRASEVLKEALQQPGPSVVVFRAPCTLVDTRNKRREGLTVTPAKITEKCTNCLACIRLLGCPAMTVEEGKVRIDENSCAGCGLCFSICPFSAIEVRCAE